ncbi:MAG: epoxyqueuosine reductase QueH, partial [Acutalibacteraceae bacterium]|nr:epoxyqueuosine reductase QueH [Acutalibacteraceae bacterium]
MNKINYQKKLDELIEAIEKNGSTPSLLLHSCCAPCSSYVIEYLSNYFSITVYYYNPNIFPDKEYRYRAEEQKRLIESMPVKNKVTFLEGDYIPTLFFDTVKGLENEPEGGARCEKCFNLRLESTAQQAKNKGFDYFATTLTISPLKNAQVINNIGVQLSDKYGVKYLAGDFKKKNGYKRSIVLSKEYNLYRQNYCGCVFSKRDATINSANDN